MKIELRKILIESKDNFQSEGKEGFQTRKEDRFENAKKAKFHYDKLKSSRNFLDSFYHLRKLPEPALRQYYINPSLIAKTAPLAYMGYKVASDDYDDSLDDIIDKYKGDN